MITRTKREKNRILCFQQVWSTKIEKFPSKRALGTIMYNFQEPKINNKYSKKQTFHSTFSRFLQFFYNQMQHNCLLSAYSVYQFTKP